MQGASHKSQGASRALNVSRITHYASRLYLPSSLFLGCLALYTITLSKDILPADAGEYQVVGAALGVAHPPGFALYTLLSWLATRLLFSAAAVAPAAAINFLSAVTASLTLVFLSRAVQRLTQSSLAGISSALALGFSTTFWAQATTANVRMLTAFATALALDLITQYRLRLMLHAPPSSRSPASSKFDSWSLGLIFLTLGLGVSHHGSLIFVAAILGLYTLWLNPSILRWPWPLLGGLLPFLAWLYFPLRAGAFGAPPHIATVNGWLEHILAAGFRGDLFFFANLKDLPDRLLIFGNILTFQFVWPLLVLTAFGGLVVFWRDRQSGVLLLAAFAVHTFISITYKSPQTVEYLLPAYVFLAALLGYAFAELFRVLRLFTTKSTKGKKALSAAPTTPQPDQPLTPASLLSRLLTGLLATLPIALQLNATFPSYLTLAQDASTRDYAQSLLTSAPSNAVVLASWHWATPLWYLQTVEGQRPDVEVKYVYPRTASLADDWAAEINAALPQRPVIVTSFYPQEFTALPYRFIPLGPAWQVSVEPLLTPPQGLTGAQIFGAWELLGYHLESPSSSSSIPSVEESITLLVAWRLRSNIQPHAVNFFVQIIGPDGLLYGQKDVAHPASRYVSGEVLLDRYPIVLRPDAAPGDYALVAGAYLPDGTRLAETRLTPITITARSTPPVTLHPLSRAISGAMLVGYDVDHTLPDSPRLYLHWKLGPQPVTATVLDAPLALPAGPGYLTITHDLIPGQPLTISNLQLLIPDPQSRYVPLDNSIILTGAALSPPGPLRPGQTLTVDLRFLAAQPITEDDAVSLKLFGNGWFVQSDVTPAGGAIPTLKWIAGSHIADRHTLTIPPDASPGPAQLTLTLYDAFTQRNLALLDPRLALLGPAVPLGSIEIIQP